jgi:hypothetical protein
MGCSKGGGARNMSLLVFLIEIEIEERKKYTK